MPYHSKNKGHEQDPDENDAEPYIGKRRPWSYWAKQQEQTLRRALGDRGFDMISLEAERRGITYDE